MSSKSFHLESFPVQLWSVRATKAKDRIELAIEQDKGKVPKGSEVLKPFVYSSPEGLLFWNQSASNFTKHRLRPSQMINVWNLGRIAKVSFLERLCNVDASHFGWAEYVLLFQDKSWEQIFRYVGLDPEQNMD